MCILCKPTNILVFMTYYAFYNEPMKSPTKIPIESNFNCNSRIKN